jgi:hypothetical protein
MNCEWTKGIYSVDYITAWQDADRRSDPWFN